MKLCIIIPSYNEALRIEKVVRAAQEYTPDVLVVNDGSADATEAAARASGAEVISFKENRGKGHALKCAFEHVLQRDFEAVITMDGDGQHSPGDLVNIIDGACGSDVGVVVGNRMSDPEDMPPARFVTNMLMSFILSTICRQNIPDTQCGYRLIKCSVLRKIKLISSNYEIESELLIKAARARFKIASVPVKSVYTGQTSSIHPVKDTWRFLAMLCRVTFSR